MPTPTCQVMNAAPGSRGGFDMHFRLCSHVNVWSIVDLRHSNFHRSWQFGCRYYYLALLLFDLGSFFMVVYVRVTPCSHPPAIVLPTHELLNQNIKRLVFTIPTATSDNIVTPVIAWALKYISSWECTLISPEVDCATVDLHWRPCRLSTTFGAHCRWFWRYAPLIGVLWDATRLRAVDVDT